MSLFLFLLVLGVGCGCCLWLFLDFSIYLYARVVYHRVWCGSVSYINKGWDLLQLWNFWVGILCKDILSSTGMFE